MSAPRNVLIVEDEPLIAMMLEDFLETLGHKVVAAAESLDDALAAAERGGFDFAVIDVNLKGDQVWPLASVLRDKGVAFVVATGGHVEPPPLEFSNVPVLEKPYTLDRISRAIDENASAA